MQDKKYDSLVKQYYKANEMDSLISLFKHAETSGPS